MCKRCARVLKKVWWNTASCSHLYCFFMLWRWKAATTSPGFPPSPGFPEASPAKAKLTNSGLQMSPEVRCDRLGIKKSIKVLFQIPIGNLPPPPPPKKKDKKHIWLEKSGCSKHRLFCCDVEFDGKALVASHLMMHVA